MISGKEQNLPVPEGVNMLRRLYWVIPDVSHVGGIGWTSLILGT
jgi:hypothetical protein